MFTKLLSLSTLIIFIRAQCLIGDILDNVYLFSNHGNYKILHDRDPERLQVNISGNIKCFFEQYSNSAFLLDVINSEVIVYYFSTGNVTRVAVESTISLQNANIVLDHNTITFYAVYSGIMYYAPVDLQKPIKFQVLKDLRLDSAEIVIGFGQNHLHFMNLPGLNNGEAKIFVIHYAFLQEEVQRYGSEDLFPQTSGKTVSVLKQDNSVPLEFAFIPDDFSGTFLIDTRVEGTNSSVKYPPPIKDIKSLFVATTKEIVQLTSTLEIYTLDITQNRSTKSLELNNWIKKDSSLATLLSSLSHSDNNTIPTNRNDHDGTFSKSSSISPGFSVLIVLGVILRLI